MRKSRAHQLIGTFVVLVFAMVLWEGSLSLAAQSDPLQTGSVQLVGGYAFGYDARVCQWKTMGGTYALSWEAPTERSARTVSIGNIDADADKEIVVVNYYISDSKKVGKQTINYFKARIDVYKNGSVGGTPSWTFNDSEETTLVGKDALIADVDNDGSNELVVLHGMDGKHLDIFGWLNGVFQRKGATRDFGHTIFTIDAGDADNDAKNEIVLAISGIGAPMILKFSNGIWGETTAALVPSQYLAKKETVASVGIVNARVRDADNIPGNEIVCSVNNRLMIWKYNSTTSKYDHKFASADLGAAATGVEGGDINGDGQKEVLVGTWFAAPPQAEEKNRLYVFAFENGTYQLKTSTPLWGRFWGIAMGDLDGDLRDEMALDDSGLYVFDFVGGDLSAGSFQWTYLGPYYTADEIK